VRIYSTVSLIVFLACDVAALDPQRNFYQYYFAGTYEDFNVPDVVLDVVQDKQGYIWLATRRGLIKFDGLESKTFRVANNPGLPSNTITQLFVDSKNRLFVSSEQGTSIYDSNSFKPLLFANTDAFQTLSFAEDSSNVVWMATKNGLLRYDDLDVVEFVDQPIPTGIHSLLWHSDSLYIGNTGYLSVLAGQELTSHELPMDVGGARVLDLEVHQGQIWGATDAGLVHLDSGKIVVFDNEKLVGQPVDLLLSDRDQNLWFSGGHIFGRIYPDGRVELPDVGDEVTGLVPELTEMIEDSLGQHWHASRAFGVGVIRDTPVERLSYLEGLLATDVTALTLGRNGEVYVATVGGVSTVADSEISTVFEGDFSRQHLIGAMVLAGEGNLFIGTDASLRIFNTNRGEWLDAHNNIAIGSTINALVSGIGDEVWVGTDSGLHLFSEGRLQNFSDTNHLAIESLLKDSNGKLWLGTDQGVIGFVDRKLEPQTDRGIITRGTVVAMTELPSGSIAAATADHGILIGNTKNWLRLDEQNGLPPEQIIDLESRGQDLWVVTGAGVFRTVVPDSMSAVSQNLEFQPVIAAHNYLASFGSHCCRGINGNAALLTGSDLVVASDDGVVILDTDVRDSREVAPRPYIKNVETGSLIRDFDDLANVELNATERDLQINFSAVQLSHGEHVQFRYRLRGLSDSWVYAGSERSAHFLNLRPGEFSFELQATLHPDNWPAEIVSIDFSRSPGLLETTAMRIVLWVSVVTVLMFLTWSWIGLARRRHSRLETRIQARTAELNEINEKLTQANKRLLDTTNTDPLTGLLNRRFFANAQKEVRLREHVSDEGLVALIDIDLFKRVNDAYGHSAGDEILCQFAKVLEAAVGADDIASRWGGEEFLIICRCPHGESGIILDRVCRQIRNFDFQLLNGQRIKLTCSIGGVRYPLASNQSFEDSFSTLVEIADAALYSVKMHGRNGWGQIEDGGTLGKAEDGFGLSAYQVGNSLDETVQKGLLGWKSSRSEISLSMADTVTRLRTLATPEE